MGNQIDVNKPITIPEKIKRPVLRSQTLGTDETGLHNKNKVRYTIKFLSLDGGAGVASFGKIGRSAVAMTCKFQLFGLKASNGSQDRLEMKRKAWR